jgi:hypothetical protein
VGLRQSVEKKKQNRKEEKKPKRWALQGLRMSWKR